MKSKHDIVMEMVQELRKHDAKKTLQLVEAYTKAQKREYEEREFNT
jgi:hypothetical protein